MHSIFLLPFILYCILPLLFVFIEARQITVNGKEYEVVDVLGTGGEEKTVYKVKRNGNFYALKEGAGFVEITATRACQGTGVVNFIDGEVNGLSGNLVTQMGVKTLGQAMADGDFKRLSLKKIKSQLAEALKTIHNAGWTHGDLAEPGNVMIFSGGIYSGFKVKIIDFGGAIRSSHPQDLANDRKKLGELIAQLTPHFPSSSSGH